MGSSVFLDIIGSVAIGGLLILMLMRLNSSKVENFVEYTDELMIQSNLTNLVSIIEYDFRKIGYCADVTEVMRDMDNGFVQFADTNRIRFRADLNRTGSFDLVEYFLGPTSDLANTPNPNDRFLIRRINNVNNASASMGLTRFRLRYFNRTGDEINTPITTPQALRTISSISIDLMVENPNYNADLDSLNLLYTKESYAIWRQVRVVTKNLGR